MEAFCPLQKTSVGRKHLNADSAAWIGEFLCPVVCLCCCCNRFPTLRRSCSHSSYTKTQWPHAPASSTPHAVHYRPWGSGSCSAAAPDGSTAVSGSHTLFLLFGGALRLLQTSDLWSVPVELKQALCQTSPGWGESVHLMTVSWHGSLTPPRTLAACLQLHLPSARILQDRKIFLRFHRNLWNSICKEMNWISCFSMNSVKKKTARQLLKRLNMFTFFQWNRMFPGTGRRKTTRNNKEMLRFETEKEGEEDDCNQHWWRGPGLRTLSELSFGLQKDPEPDVRKILVWQLELHRCSVKTRSDLRNWRLNVYSSQKKPTSKQSHTCFQSVMWSTPTPLTEPFQTCQTEVKMTGFYQSKDFFSVCSWQISPQSCWGWYLLGLWLLIHWES